MDTPAVKATYTSTVTSYLPVLMSALRVSPPSEEVLAISHDKEVTYKYRQPVAIPSYLIAIAALVVYFYSTCTTSRRLTMMCANVEAKLPISE
jgi:leukotriene-A4 hydrolase